MKSFKLLMIVFVVVLIGKISPISEIEDHFTYEFTTPNELVPGDWSIEIWRNGEKLVFKSFKVK